MQDRVAGREYRLAYDKLILSPGAEPVRPPICRASTRRRSSRSASWPTWTRSSIAWTQAAGKAVIIGGGYIGLEMAEALRDRKLGVSIVELENQVFGPMDPEMAAPLAHNCGSTASSCCWGPR